MSGIWAINRGILTAGLIVLASTAFADAVDGDWCSRSGLLHIRIEGSTVTTTGGQQIGGNYSRHAFSYTIPEGEPGGGGTFRMQLLSEEQARVTQADTAPEMWYRCQLNS